MKLNEYGEYLHENGRWYSGVLNEFGEYVFEHDEPNPIEIPSKIWNGSTWVAPIGIHTWNGSLWLDVIAMKHWNGSGWV